MAYHPDVNDALTIEKVTYRFTKHPGAQGMSIPYGQAGRRGTVFQLIAPDDSLYALKVFTHSFRVPRNAAGVKGLRPFASLPGLQVCSRSVIIPSPDNSSATQSEDLDYAVLMPWVTGSTWQQIMLGRQPISVEQSCALARALVHIIETMEMRNLAHCDLSAANVVMTLHSPSVSLVDVEDLYAPGLSRPDKLPGGSRGYAHHTAPQGLWGPNSDRFAGAVLLAEMLCWCDERVRRIAVGETYFHPDEMQQNCERLQVMLKVLGERYGAGVVEVFTQAWYSSTLDECPSAARWAQLLNPTEVTTREVEQDSKAHLKQQLALLMVETAKSLLDLGEIDRAVTEGAEANRIAPNLREARNIYARALLMRGKTKEQKGDLKSALVDYRAALPVTPQGGMHDELVAIISDLKANIGASIAPDKHASSTMKSRTWGKPRWVPVSILGDMQSEIKVNATPDGGKKVSQFYPPPYKGYAPVPTQTRHSDGFAIAALILGIVGPFVPCTVWLSIIFGAIALRRIRQSGAKGRGLAIAGIVLGSSWLVLFVFVLVASATISRLNSAQRSPGGSVTVAGNISTLDLQVGDCVTRLPSGTTFTVHVAPCSDAHVAEVYYLYTVPGGSYPGEVQIEQLATEACQEALPDYVSSTEESASNAYEINYLYPLRSSWPTDRTIACMASDASGTLLVGSVRSRGARQPLPTP